MFQLNALRSVLVVAAHPDDEVLGAGGTIARLIEGGTDVRVLILGEGKAARGGPEGPGAEVEALKKELRSAMQILGVQTVEQRSFPDNQFDAVPLLQVVQEIEAVCREFEPEVVLTHHPGDINIDHQVTSRAVLTATRPVPDATCQMVLSFEVPSSTEWNQYSEKDIFVPNFSIDISAFLEKKLAALSEYRTELRDFPHPRSIEHVSNWAKSCGSQMGCLAAERFRLIRGLI